MDLKFAILDVHAYTHGPAADGHHFFCVVEILAPIREEELTEAFKGSLKSRYDLPPDAETNVTVFGYREGETWHPGNRPMFVMDGKVQEFEQPPRATQKSAN